MRTKSVVFVLLGFLLLGIGAHRARAEEASIDPAAQTLLNDFITALLIDDEDASAQATLKYVHKSLMNDAASDLTADLRRFSFKKAHSGAKFYAVPVQITRVRPTATSAIGFGKTAQAGKVVDYFIAKKPGINGMPAPVKVFFPSDGSAPKISYMGSI